MRTKNLEKARSIIQYVDSFFEEYRRSPSVREIETSTGIPRDTVHRYLVCLSNLYEKLYEDNATGKVSDEWFMQLSHKYEVERLELKAKIKTLRQKLSECGQCERDRETFTSAIRRFMRMDSLTAPLLRELIDHIDVFETEGTGKSRHRESLSTTALSGMWKSPRYLKDLASKQTPEKVLPWSI